MTGAETPFESRGSRDGQRDLALLRSFLAFYRALGLILGVVVMAIWLAEPSPWILLMGATAFTYAAVLTVARRQSSVGDVVRAVLLVNLAVWPLTLLGAFVAPISFPVQAMSAIPAALIAVAYLPPRAGRRLLAITAISTVAVTAICRFVSVIHVADQVNQQVIDAVLLGLLPGLVVLISAIGWQSHRVLDERATELDRSRARLLAAAEEERRRVDTDLRKTAQRRIENALVQLESALDAKDAGGDPDPIAGEERESPCDVADAYLSRATADLQAAIVDLRQIVTRLRPAALAEHGLDASLHSALQQQVFRTPIKLVTRNLDRYDDPVEGAAWFGCVEAIDAFERVSTGSPPVLLVEGGPTSLRFSATVEAPLPTAMADLSRAIIAIDDRLATVDGYATLNRDERRGSLAINGTIPTTSPRPARSAWLAAGVPSTRTGVREGP